MNKQIMLLSVSLCASVCSAMLQNGFSQKELTMAQKSYMPVNITFKDPYMMIKVIKASHELGDRVFLKNISATYEGKDASLNQTLQLLLAKRSAQSLNLKKFDVLAKCAAKNTMVSMVYRCVETADACMIWVNAHVTVKSAIDQLLQDPNPETSTLPTFFLDVAAESIDGIIDYENITVANALILLLQLKDA